MENSTTNTILYSKNADEVLYPGSTVKIMTCLLALENSSAYRRGDHDRRRVSGVTDGGASTASQVDEVFTVRTVSVRYHGCLCQWYCPADCRAYRKFCGRVYTDDE
ncbi:MAG: hypothetical protein V8Q57_07250 [Blautia sp.]